MICKKCGKEQDLGLFPTVKIKGKEYKRHVCKICLDEYDSLRHKKRLKANPEYWRNKQREAQGRYIVNNPDKLKEKGKKDRLNGKQKKYRALNREKYLAHKKVHNAIISGKLQKPESCSECGSITNVQYHHPDYSKPLDVVALCSKCHGKTYRI